MCKKNEDNFECFRLDVDWRTEEFCTTADLHAEGRVYRTVPRRHLSIQGEVVIKDTGGTRDTPKNKEKKTKRKKKICQLWAKLIFSHKWKKRKNISGEKHLFANNTNRVNDLEMSWYCCRRSLGSLLLDGTWTRKIIGTEEVDGVALSKTSFLD